MTHKLSKNMHIELTSKEETKILKVILNSTIKAKNLFNKLDPNFLGDSWIAKSLSEIEKRFKAMNDALNSKDMLFSGFREKHPKCKEGYASMLSKNNTSDQSPISKWRKSLNKESYFDLPLNQRKEVFDYYFRCDLYGEYRDDETIILSSGTKALSFFSPPAAIRLSLDVANRNNWFGYSDSLGHIETRSAIARLESFRRGCDEIKEENIAVVQGGTQGLNVILGLLSNIGIGGKLIAALPNYAPLIDDISNHFEFLPFNLNLDYTLDLKSLSLLLEDEGTIGVVLNLPHNPPLTKAINKNELCELADKCSILGKYLIIDEMNFCKDQSDWYVPSRHKTTILIHSYSKRFAIPGLKIGHVLTSKEIISNLYRYASSSYGSPPSFLYLCITTINAMELMRLNNDFRLFNKDIIESFSNPKYLEEEYDLWCNCEYVFENVIEILLQRIATIRLYPSIKKIAESESGSCNKNICTNLKNTSYESFLHVLFLKNVSLFPMECLLITDNRPDLRVTVTVDPNSLINGLTAAFEVTDSLFAKQESGKWLNNDDSLIIHKVGLLSQYPEFNLLGHLYRVNLRLNQIATLFKIDVPSWLYRVAALHDIGKCWTHISFTERTIRFAELFNLELSTDMIECQSDTEWSKYLLKFIAQSNVLPTIPDEILLSLDLFWNMKKGPKSEAKYESLLDLADKTSDFISKNILTWQDLELALRLKIQQTLCRYPVTSIQIRDEFDSWFLNGKDFFSTFNVNNEDFIEGVNISML